ncbi:MAG TPA: hypothetical protein VGQ41_05035 [Pyrinomonadaceae bacterium]|nr:hypothetical protein [Pyrinomonadaceae bacterium]
MKRLTSKSLFGILVLGLMLLVGMSSDAMAQGRGRRASNWDKKCAKFVNCHDARDGRWDGRGPNRDFRFGNIFRRNRRDRDRDFDRFERRRRHRDRDWDDRRWRRNR